MPFDFPFPVVAKCVDRALATGRGSSPARHGGGGSRHTAPIRQGAQLLAHPPKASSSHWAHAEPSGRAQK